MKLRSAFTSCINVGLILLLSSLVLAGAQSKTTNPSIEFTVIPFTDKGGTEGTSLIQGRVVGGRPDQLIILFAKSGSWYVQPFVDHPFTKLEPDLTWRNSTHLGTEYAALLVEPGYVPPNVTDVLPGTGSGVIAVRVVPGTPFFYQTWWFRLLIGLLAAFGVLQLFRWRQRRLIRELNLRFEQRLAERTRIAQDLHDTLLQGLLSASMQLHVANEHLPLTSPAKPMVGRVLELMSEVIDEGRNAVRGLRTPGASFVELEQAFSRIPQQLPMRQSVDYQVTVEGSERQLRPIIRDEVYRVGHEALVNAFRHSEADRVELEMQYTAKQLTLLVRDNGKGIDSSVIREGREGHWGLSGMRERAQEIGGKLRVWSRIGAGTEVELTIPGHIAYESDQLSLKWYHRWMPWKGEVRAVGQSESSK
jgi:signal transduction histidine kinase